jgi:hypothetical protein
VFSGETQCILDIRGQLPGEKEGTTCVNGPLYLTSSRKQANDEHRPEGTSNIENQSDTGSMQTEYHPEKNLFVQNRKELAAIRIETWHMNLVTISARKQNFHCAGLQPYGIQLQMA